ncbi:hypothetical protein GW796_10685 [archaeon]|nr:hypothetical protein [archaeon]NCQ52328.1 hypothetical protein [archaeon]
MLNKTKPQHNPISWRDDSQPYSKGVKSDLIFTHKTNKAYIKRSSLDPSFAISFTYIDLPFDKQTIEVSIKPKPNSNNNSICSSGLMTVRDFQEKLNKINIDFKTDNIQDYKIIDQISNVFLNKNYDLSEQIENASQEIKKVKEDKRKRTF